jgi:hypothetical protein
VELSSFTGEQQIELLSGQAAWILSKFLFLARQIPQHNFAIW